MVNPTLFEIPPVLLTVRERAEVWIDENPVAFGMFEQFALELGSKGRKFGINLLRERVRWECTFRWDGEFKICNSFSPYIARRLLKQYPHLKAYMICHKTQDERSKP